MKIISNTKKLVGFIFFLLALTSYSYSQGAYIYITNVKYMGVNIPNCGTINLGSSDTHIITFDLKITRPYGSPQYTNTLDESGVLKIKYLTYYGTYTVSTININAGNWIIDTSNNEWFLNRPLSVTLHSSNISESGGILYAEYDTPNDGNTPYTSCNYNFTVPKFILSPNNTNISCGAMQTFTVSNVNNSPGTKSYNWQVGSGWLYNGNVTSNFTTSTNSIQLTAYQNPLGNVKVTPVLDGVSQTQLISTISLTSFTSTATISGPTSFCTLESSSIYTINAGAGNTVTWSSSNSQIASVSSGTNSQVIVTAHSQGLFYVNALITNPCGQTVPKSTVNPITVGTPMPLIDGFTCISESTPCNLDIQANNNYLIFSLSAPSGTYVPQDSDWQWEKVSGNFYFLDNGQYNSSTHTGRQGNIYLTGANPTDNPLQFRCRFKNTCGWGQWRNYVWNDGTTTPVTPPTPPANYYTIVPNPSGGYSANITLLDPTITPTTTSPIIVKLYTIFGQELSSTQLYNNSGMIYIYSFPYNTMYIIISFDTHSESHTIVKY